MRSNPIAAQLFICLWVMCVECARKLVHRATLFRSGAARVYTSHCTCWTDRAALAETGSNTCHCVSDFRTFAFRTLCELWFSCSFLSTYQFHLHMFVLHSSGSWEKHNFGILLEVIGNSFRFNLLALISVLSFALSWCLCQCNIKGEYFGETTCLLRKGKGKRWWWGGGGGANYGYTIRG